MLPASEKISIERKIFLALAATFSVLLAVGGAAWWNALRFKAAFRLVDHTHEVLYSLEETMTKLLVLQADSRGYALTASESLLTNYDADEAALRAAQARVRRLVADSANQLRRLDQMDPLMARALVLLRERMAVRRNSGLGAVTQTRPNTTGRPLVDRIGDLIGEMETEERRLLDARIADWQAAASATVGGVLVSCGLAAAFAALAGWIIHRDFAERRRIEKALEHERYLLGELMTNATDTIYFKDRESRFIRINRELARQFGLGAPAEAIGRSDFDFHAADHARPAFEDEQEVMRTGQPLSREEKVTRPGGRVVWLLTTKLPLRDAAGSVVGTFGISRDITDRKDSEQQAQLANQQLRAANEELEAFSYSVSHDLRAPLRHVDGFAGLLESHAGAALDGKGRRYVATMRQAATQMGQLIDDLLSFSRLGRASFACNEVDQNALLAAVIADGRYEGEGRAIIWEISSLPSVRGDAPMLRQVWANLVGNAVKYSRQATPARIAISCSDTGGASPEHVFSVRDNGVGFNPAYASKLFGVFQRLHDARQFEGTGIGLANVRRIVTRHGGRTWAESEVGQGATFFFSLPIAPPAQPAS